MAAITIRQLDDATKQRLRMRAAANGRSMEAEARSILVSALSSPDQGDLNWIQQIVAVADAVGGVDLPVPEDAVATAADFGAHR